MTDDTECVLYTYERGSYRLTFGMAFFLFQLIIKLKCLIIILLFLDIFILYFIYIMLSLVDSHYGPNALKPVH